MIMRFSDSFPARLRSARLLRTLVRAAFAACCLSGVVAAAETEPFHPIGIFIDLNRFDFHQEPIEHWIRQMHALESLGFNTAVVKSNEAMLEQAELLDFRIVTGASLDNPERTRRFERYDSLLAWYGMDEPGRLGVIEEAKKQYAQARQVISRPLAVSLYLPSAYGEANELADILLPDPYIFGHVKRDRTYYGLEEISRRIAALKSRLASGKRLWAVPQLYAWHPFFKRPPTPDELEVQTITCLGEGAEGILYFALNSGQYYPHPPGYEPVEKGEPPTPWELYDHPELLDRLKKMNRISRHILYEFDAGAEKKSLEDGAIRYTWRRGEKSFSAEVRLKPRLHVDYSF